MNIPKLNVRQYPRYITTRKIKYLVKRLKQIKKTKIKIKIYPKNFLIKKEKRFISSFKYKKVDLSIRFLKVSESLNLIKLTSAIVKPNKKDNINNINKSLFFLKQSDISLLILFNIVIKYYINFFIKILLNQIFNFTNFITA